MHWYFVIFADRQGCIFLARAAATLLTSGNENSKSQVLAGPERT